MLASAVPYSTLYTTPFSPHDCRPKNVTPVGVDAKCRIRVLSPVILCPESGWTQMQQFRFYVQNILRPLLHIYFHALFLCTSLEDGVIVMGVELLEHKKPWMWRSLTLDRRLQMLGGRGWGVRGGGKGTPCLTKIDASGAGDHREHRLSSLVTMLATKRRCSGTTSGFWASEVDCRYCSEMRSGAPERPTYRLPRATAV